MGWKDQGKGKKGTHTKKKTEIYTINILSNVSKINHVQQNNKLGSKTRSLFLCSFIIFTLLLNIPHRKKLFGLIHSWAIFLIAENRSWVHFSFFSVVSFWIFRWSAFSTFRWTRTRGALITARGSTTVKGSATTRRSATRFTTTTSAASTATRRSATTVIVAARRSSSSTRLF